MINKNKEITILIKKSRIEGLTSQEKDRLAILLAIGNEEQDDQCVAIFYDYLVPEFMKQVRNMLSCFDRTIDISREKNYLKRLISAEITKVYNNVVFNKKRENNAISKND